MEGPETAQRITTDLATPPDILDLSPRCPWRPPDWRWRLARLRAGGVRLLRESDDEWVRRVVGLLRSARTDGVRHPPHDARDHALDRAIDLHTRPDDTLRQAIEYRTLAGVTVDDIAARVDIP